MVPSTPEILYKKKNTFNRSQCSGYKFLWTFSLGAVCQFSIQRHKDLSKIPKSCRPWEATQLVLQSCAPAAQNWGLLECQRSACHAGRRVSMQPQRLTQHVSVSWLLQAPMRKKTCQRDQNQVKVLILKHWCRQKFTNAKGALWNRWKIDNNSI